MSSRDPPGLRQACPAPRRIRPASDFGLHFIPLATEHYLLAWPRGATGSNWHDALKRILADHGAMAALGQLPGYDFQAAGEAGSLAKR